MGGEGGGDEGDGGGRQGSGGRSRAGPTGTRGEVKAVVVGGVKRGGAEGAVEGRRRQREGGGEGRGPGTAAETTGKADGGGVKAAGVAQATQRGRGRRERGTARLSRTDNSSPLHRTRGDGRKAGRGGEESTAALLLRGGGPDSERRKRGGERRRRWKRPALDDGRLVSEGQQYSSCRPSHHRCGGGMKG